MNTYHWDRYVPETQKGFSAQEIFIKGDVSWQKGDLLSGVESYTAGLWRRRVGDPPSESVLPLARTGAYKSRWDPEVGESYLENAIQIIEDSESGEIPEEVVLEVEALAEWTRQPIDERKRDSGLQEFVATYVAQRVEEIRKPTEPLAA